MKIDIEKHEQKMKELDLQNRVRRGQAAIDRGELLYYRIVVHTNARYMIDNTPVIYTCIEAARIVSEHRWVPIKVSDYNEMFGRFME